MKYSVFVSHSMNQDDLGVVYETARQAEAAGISLYIAERDWQFGTSLPAKIENAIRTCDHFVAFWTHGGAHSQYVNQEIGFAKACGRPRVFVVEKGEQVKGFDVDKEYVELDRGNPQNAISQLNSFLAFQMQQKQARAESERQSEQQRKMWLTVTGIVGLIALLSGEK
jgi:hypothetical protein